MKEIFQSALERAPQERSAFVREVCGNDDGVRTEVESLLFAHHEAGNFAEAGLAMSDLGFDLIGREIGAYRILSLLGAGGMGEVYRARDTKLGRDVAIKILPPTFSSDPERRARFEREARVLATLNHPHIGAIYGLEYADDVQALVLELVEGETLAERLAKGSLSIAECLTIGRQVIDALEAAHEKGIVHRDLKPANIKITPNGTVKVLDFGLAKTTGPHTPAISADATREGTILGTAAYMSPEQARGHQVDKRTDIWSFGCVLYEMLTGRLAFDRATVSDTIAAIIEREPDWNALPPGISPTLKIYLQRCLQKNLRDRVHDVADLRLALEGAFDGPAGDSKKSLWHSQSLVAIAAIVFAVFGATTAWLLNSGPTETLAVAQPVARMSVRTGPLAVRDRAQAPAIALSPDGSQLVYVAGDGATGQLYVRRLDSFEAKPIPGADNAHGPFFSPDGEWIAFFSGTQLKKAPLAGGPLVVVCDIPESSPVGGSWQGDDRIIFAVAAGEIWRVSGSAGKPELIIRTDATPYWPEVLPDGNTVLFTAAGPQIWMHSLRTGQHRVLVERGSHARYVSSGHLVYASEGLLMAAPFDAKRLELLGPATPVIEGVMMIRPGAAALGHFAVSTSGVLAYLAGPVRNSQQALHSIDRRGREESLNVERRSYWWPKVSPDGTRVAVEVFQSGNRDIWIHDLVRKSSIRLTLDPADDGRPVWTPDGERVVFRSNRDRGGFNLFWQRVDGAGQAERLTNEPNADRTAWAFTPDGKMLLVTQVNPGTGLDVHLLSMESGYGLKPLLQGRFYEGSPNLSRDGRWIAYRSDEPGTTEIFVRPFPNVAGGKWQVSTDGGAAPLWGSSGGELFYRTGDSMMAVPIETQPTFMFGKPQVLFSKSYIANMANVDIFPEGQRFLIIKDHELTPESSPPDQISIVLNWSEELKKLVPVRSVSRPMIPR